MTNFAGNRISGRQNISQYRVGDLCKTPPFAQFLRCVRISILKIFNIFLRLKSSSALILNEIERFSKVSQKLYLKEMT